MAGISFDELLRHNEEETEHWRQWFEACPAALNVPLDIASVDDVRELVVHILAVEALYTERLVEHTRERVDLKDFPSSTVSELFSTGTKARNKYREYLQQWSDADWDQIITFGTLTAGTQSVSRRKAFVHAMLHSMRHWAQIATALRQAGFKQDWPHDFLLTKVMK